MAQNDGFEMVMNQFRKPLATIIHKPADSTKFRPNYLRTGQSTEDQAVKGSTIIWCGNNALGCDLNSHQEYLSTRFDSLRPSLMFGIHKVSTSSRNK